MNPRRSRAETLRQIGEDGLVRRIRGWLDETARRTGAPKTPPWARMKIEVGIGDDTAIVRSTRGAPPLALTTDMLVEGIHFLPDHPPEALGAKAVASNLSDLAAVGAWPAWILVSLGAPPDTSAKWVEALYRGIRSAAEPFGCFCIGGDCVRAKALTLNIVAGGHVSLDSKVPLRSRARPGQSLYVTGTLGDSAAGLVLLRGRRRFRTPSERRDAQRLIERHRRPTPRVEAGIAIARYCPDAAMMDLSDGLASDLPRLAEASGCGFEIEPASLPVSFPLQRLAPLGSRTAQDLALDGGEDYELLFATRQPPEKWLERVARAAPGRPLRVTRIGRAVKGKDLVCVDRRGGCSPLGAGRFKHF
ncbi:thiamine-phosphate kinase [Candidatus Sumerlaeota bacterium]|nr:thiamine-phosphate kinase [Candidatus Sumerlaeota bacterium]